MTKAEEILRKEITLFEWGKKNDKQLITYEDALKAVNKAINYTHSCKSDSELLLCGVCDEETKHDTTLRNELHCLKCGNVAKE